MTSFSSVFKPIFYLLMLSLTLPAAVTAENLELIPFKEFTLANGLTLIVHEDSKAPVVAVNIWYHVGSRNEKPGQTGYAHLFEHLMFQGSENAPDDYLNQLKQMGATGLNGTTWFDRTNYFQTVPVGALDRVLFLESDRMGHMLGAVTQAVLDEQRGVVQNEKRQRDDQPYSSIFALALKQIFPPGHPYSWSTIGSMEDLEAASLEEMHEWFSTYYGPQNSVLVIAGDVEADEVLKRVDHYFGDIPAGPPLTVHEEWIPRHTVERRVTVQDRVPQERLYLAWSAPRWGTTEARQLSLAADILASGKNSRLYERLVYNEQLASDLDGGAYFFEIAGLLLLEISVKAGENIDVVERIAKEELQRLVDKGPSRQELQRVKTVKRAEFLRAIEKVGGRGGSKSSVLAEFAVYGDDAAGYQRYLDEIAAATPEQVRKATQVWLGEQAPFVAHYLPYPTLAANTEGADRSDIPAQLETAPASFKPFSRITLDNGLQVIVVERASIPVLNLSLTVDGGYATDAADQASNASVAMSMLDEGTKKRDALAISAELAQLGATLSARADLDSTSVTMSALTENLDDALAIFADVVLNPTFPEAELPRIRSMYLANIQQEKSQPLDMALRVLPALMYGEGHPYAKPLTGSGTESGINAVTSDSLKQWHELWFRPNNATLIVVGDTTLADIKPRIENLFRDWRKQAVPEKVIPIVEPPAGTILYLLDKPGAVQSMIFAGQLIAPMNNPQETAIEAMDDILGGQFSARINMNLREDKGWSYGARSVIKATAKQRPWLVYAPVQSDKTAQSLAEMLREIEEFVGETPAREEELQRVKRTNVLSLAGRWETSPAVLRDLQKLVANDLGDDYWNNYAARLTALQLSQVTAAATNTLKPEQLVWVVVGDRATIEAELRALDIGEIRLLDADGNNLNF
ncbi:MAG: zinc protease [Halieaceae bacterium]|jgi:zinc protease